MEGQCRGLGLTLACQEEGPQELCRPASGCFAGHLSPETQHAGDRSPALALWWNAPFPARGQAAQQQGFGRLVEFESSSMRGLVL